MRQRCYHCFRPAEYCYCPSIPQIDNRTDVVILQHVAERFHPFNTARIVHRALNRSQLVVDHNRRLGLHAMRIEPNAGLLFPQPDAPILDDLSIHERPSQLVIVDGTWHQAKTIVRDVPQLRQLRRFRLAPEAPGQYRIRREPNAYSLSTVEATVAALRVLEPETDGLQQLLDAFARMVETQLNHRGTRVARQRARPRRNHPSSFGKMLLNRPTSIVVAYGESTPGGRGQRVRYPLPVHWVAKRFGTDDDFTCCLQQREPLPPEVLQHMRLPRSDFDTGLTADEFRERWARFLQRDDILIVHHPRTQRLLQHISAPSPPALFLKSIFRGRGAGFNSIEDLLASEGLPIPQACEASRGNHRLAMAVALVAYLQREQLAEQAELQDRRDDASDAALDHAAVTHE